MSILYDKDTSPSTGVMKNDYKKVANSFKNVMDDRIRKVDYNTYMPLKTSEGDEFFITKETVATRNNPAFKNFDEGIVSFKDSSLIPEYGNYKGYDYDKDGDLGNNMYYLSNTSGDTSRVQKALEGGMSAQDLGF